MITEDYVSFETAKLLKEKGFDENTYMWWYTVYGELGEYDVTDRGRRPELYINAPTLQMAMKWLREEHNIFIEISVDEALNEHGYQWALFDNTIKRIRPYAGWGDTYEQSCEAAIKFCLENLI